MNIALINLVTKNNYLNTRSPKTASFVSFCSKKTDEIISCEASAAQKAQILASCELKKQKLLKDLVAHVEKLTSQETFEKIIQAHNEAQEKKSKYIFKDSSLGIQAKSIEVTMFQDRPFWIKVKKDKFSSLTEISCAREGLFFARIHLNKKYGGKEVMIYYGANNKINYIDYGVEDGVNLLVIEEVYELDESGKFVLSEKNSVLDYQTFAQEIENIPF